MDHAIAKRIHSARVKLGITQAELARRSKLTPGAVCHYEKGIRVPQTASLMRLSKALHVTVGWLLGEAR